MRLRKLITTPITSVLRRMGYHIQPYAPPSVFPRDFDQDTINDILTAKNYTMTPVMRIVALCNAVRYIVANKIPGDIVECGVWKGGSMMAVAHTLVRLGHQERDLHLFDTFEGMPEPTEEDTMWNGMRAHDLWQQERQKTKKSDWFCLAPLEGVKNVMSKTGYDPRKIHFIKGKVEDTLPEQAPSAIGLLRLDTDWYESTRHELRHLFPRLSRGGVVIFDDYGYWQGAKKAVDDYLRETGIPLFLQPIDDQARIAVKI